MENMKINQVAMGQSHTLLIIDTDDAATKKKYIKLEKFAKKVDV